MRSILVIVFALAATACRVHAQGEPETTAGQFLAMCATAHNACNLYMMGFVDGQITADARDDTKFPYCLEGISYGEIGDSYIAYLSAERVRRDVAALDRPNGLAFEDFLGLRYRCH